MLVMRSWEEVGVRHPFPFPWGWRGVLLVEEVVVVVVELWGVPWGVCVVVGVGVE